MPASLLLDLDGTLMESSPGILAAFETALQDVRIAPVVPLDAPPICPLPRTDLQRITGQDDPKWT